jgi:peptide/nickel transport system permease protein
MGKMSRLSGLLAASSLVRWGLAILMLLLILVLAAPLLAPARPYIQTDPVAGRHLPPGSRRQAAQLRDGRWLLAEEAEWTAEGLSLERRGATEIIPLEKVERLPTPTGLEQRFFLLGTDRFGRDVWSRILYGGRVSLTIGLLAATLALTLGLAVGSLAATFGGIVDSLLMRLVDGLLAFPRLFLVLTLSALFGATTWVVILVLGATSWMTAARLVRAELLQLGERDFVTAARAIGQHPVRVFWRHLLPGALAPVLVDTTLRVGDIILIEAALSFLGLGVQPPLPSWGNMIADGSDTLVSAWWVTLFPGLAIALTVIAFNLFGDGLRDLLHPRSGRSAS